MSFTLGQGLSLSAQVELVSRPELVSRSDDLGGKKVDLPDKNSKRDKEIEEEEERVFIVSTKGRYGPERPLHPGKCDLYKCAIE